MSYDAIRTINSLIESGAGDQDRLKFILKRVSEGKYLYLSDKNYLEELLQSNPIEKKSAVNNFGVNVENELNKLRSMSKRVGQIEIASKFEQEEKTRSDTKLSQNTFQEKSYTIYKKSAVQKNEDLALALSIVLGLVGLVGISQIYLGKVAKGVGIMIISFTLIGSIIYLTSPDISENQFNIHITENSFLIILVIGYLGLYIYQVFDSHNLCLTYNKYVLKYKTLPPWW
jgi:TM2 domain-containing membrane protein YozV